MFKLVKYELRANFLTILGVCITVIVANLILMTKKGSWDIAVPAVSICLTIAAIIVAFIVSLRIMSEYLHGDSGYLLFTLPQSGMSIVTSRLVTALIQTSIVIFVSLLMLYLNVTSKIDLSFLKDFKLNLVVFYVISYIWMIITSLTTIYFCMIIGKVALKGKKLGKIGSFIIFILLSMLISWVTLKINTIFPQTLNLSNFTFSNSSLINSDFSTVAAALDINIAQTIFNILIFIGLFTVSSYLIDKKLDLV